MVTLLEVLAQIRQAASEEKVSLPWKRLKKNLAHLLHLHQLLLLPKNIDTKRKRKWELSQRRVAQIGLNTIGVVKTLRMVKDLKLNRESLVFMIQSRCLAKCPRKMIHNSPSIWANSGKIRHKVACILLSEGNIYFNRANRAVRAETDLAPKLKLITNTSFSNKNSGSAKILFFSNRFVKPERKKTNTKRNWLSKDRWMRS